MKYDQKIDLHNILEHTVDPCTAVEQTTQGVQPRILSIENTGITHARLSSPPPGASLLYITIGELTIN